MKTVFIDRDGVINRDRDDYVRCVSEFQFLPGVKEALRRLAESGYRVVVISNQQAIGRGLMSLEALDEIDIKLREEVAEAGGRIDATYYCPHLEEENCGCRKPATGLLDRASRDFDVRLSETFLVGDAGRDIEAGKKAGCRTILVLSGKLTAVDIDSLPVKPDCVASDLYAAVDKILESETLEAGERQRKSEGEV